MLGWRKKIYINNKTSLYLSCSSSPGNFGATLYNYFFQKNRINAVYIPRSSDDAKALIQSIRYLDCAGCSISMPLKSQIIPFLDEIESAAHDAHSVNTIKNINGSLIGYNTDIYGASKVLDSHHFTNATIYGTGSVVGSLIVALRALGIVNIKVIGRNLMGAIRIREIFELGEDLEPDSIDLLINATPGSFLAEHQMLFQKANIVFDLVVSNTDTKIISKAKKEQKIYLTGLEMAMHQFHRQFYLYTGVDLNIREIRGVIEKCIKNK